ncbi:MAG: EAL domain-containing protein [Lachnospiraceae bacterium]
MENDYLTGLPNHKNFLIQGADIVTKSHDNFVAVSLDVSNFKYLNDMYGLECGDEVIKLIANYFFIDDESMALATRITSDQFRAIFTMEGRTIEEEMAYLREKCARLEKILSKTYPKVYLHTYCGVYEIDKTNFNMRIAIDKSHFAKKEIKGNYQISCSLYKDEEYNDKSAQMKMICTFENACAADGIKLFFQPKFDCSRNKLIGAEALCRLMDEEGNILGPRQFIPVLEKSGMLSHLDEIMMRKTFECMKIWNEHGKLNFPVSINVSRINFFNRDIVKQVSDMQQEYGIPANMVELEITETTFIENLDTIRESVIQLRDKGFRISVDDFGSGYSSLGLITSIPADVIKLDCAFAREGLKTPKGIKIIESIISMLKSVDFDIICEGIETNEEAKLVERLGCSKIQGFLYDKPMSAEEFSKKYIFV